MDLVGLDGLAAARGPALLLQVYEWEMWKGRKMAPPRHFLSEGLSSLSMRQNFFFVFMVS